MEISPWIPAVMISRAGAGTVIGAIATVESSALAIGLGYGSQVARCSWRRRSAAVRRARQRGSGCRWHLVRDPANPDDPSRTATAMPGFSSARVFNILRRRDGARQKRGCNCRQLQVRYEIARERNRIGRWPLSEGAA